MFLLFFSYIVFFFNDTATTEIYTLSLHDALPICGLSSLHVPSEFCHKRLRSAEILPRPPGVSSTRVGRQRPERDRKSTRLNSSHTVISYAVFCLKKKKKSNKEHEIR